MRLLSSRLGIAGLERGLFQLLSQGLPDWAPPPHDLVVGSEPPAVAARAMRKVMEPAEEANDDLAVLVAELLTGFGARHGRHTASSLDAIVDDRNLLDGDDPLKGLDRKEFIRTVGAGAWASGFFLIRRLPRSSLFPYTTVFRCEARAPDIVE